MKKKISIVIPCHNEENNLKPLTEQIVKFIPKTYDYEIILVDDGSKDATKSVIYKLSKQNKRIKGIIFHKNFGHQLALLSGIDNAKGRAIITLDADFQHPPSKIPEILKLWEKGHDFVQLQKDEINRNLLSPRGIAYKVWEWISGGVLIPGASDFRLIDENIARFLTDSEEREIFLRGLTNIAAANPITIQYHVGRRKHGSSSYNLKMFINMFVNGLISYSTFPLRIGSVVGFLIASFSTIILATDTLRALLTGKRIVEGYVTIVFLMLILNGFIIFYMGILGEYMGVIFKEVKKRPKYLIRETFNIKPRI